MIQYQTEFSLNKDTFISFERHLQCCSIFKENVLNLLYGHMLQ